MANVTVAALECLKYLHKDRDENTPTTDSPIPKLFPWALQCLPILLDCAAITDALVQSARRHNFSQKSKDFPDDESAAKLGISRLLSKKPRNFIRNLVGVRSVVLPVGCNRQLPLSRRITIDMLLTWVSPALSKLGAGYIPVVR